jgi:Holliday junction resolvasome RuvABC endonuclease subunit
MGQARAKQVAFMIEEHLGLVDQTPKRSGMNDPITIALKL